MNECVVYIERKFEIPTNNGTSFGLNVARVQTTITTKTHCHLPVSRMWVGNVVSFIAILMLQKNIIHPLKKNKQLNGREEIPCTYYFRAYID